MKSVIPQLSDIYDKTFFSFNSFWIYPHLEIINSLPYVTPYMARFHSSNTDEKQLNVFNADVW